MAIELEKIAALLEDAYERIGQLESENARLKSISGGDTMIEKEASPIFFDKDEEDDIFSMGSVADVTPASGISADARLDDFLNG